ncbi:GlxA family transcriptional regulator [Microbulbifer litoralis]|uniref:GlxA family transcriptional regulator n=1 Tax=Microbulbifer litoralis TaxID=2933965 RepID=UPI0020279D5C|nr:helix-turn-helix domain-containing protein [Microbulbifer sp. GX H0434]
MKAPPPDPATEPLRRVSMVIYPGAQCLDITGPLEVFSLANRQLRESGHIDRDVYEIQMLAETPGPVATSSGIRLSADGAYTDAGDIHTLLVCGGEDVAVARQQQNEKLRQWLYQRAGRVQRLGSICNGALLLAGAGLLDGRRAATHWMDVDLLRVFERVDVDADAIFVRDGNIYSSAGITAGMDLALALVEEDFGRTLSLAVARRLVLYLKRDGGQQQYSSHLSSQVDSDRFAELVEWIYGNLAQPLGVDTLAQRSLMSPRNFARLFTDELGCTPAKFVERARTEKARHLLADSALPQEKVAAQCGFRSQEQLRRAFLRQLGILPGDYRRRFGRESD